MSKTTSDLKDYSKEPKGIKVANPTFKTRNELNDYNKSKDKAQIVARTEAGHQSIKQKKAEIDKFERDIVIKGMASEDVQKGAKPVTLKQLAKQRKKNSSDCNAKAYDKAPQGLHGRDLPTFYKAAQTDTTIKTCETDQSQGVVNWWKQRPEYYNPNPVT